MLLFISRLDCRFRRSDLNNTHLYKNEVGENTATGTSASLSHSVRALSSSPSLSKKLTKSGVDKKIQACETLTLTEGFLFSSYRCLKQSVSRLLTGQNTFFGGVAFKYLVETIIDYCYCMQGFNFTVCSGVGWNTFKV